MNKHQIKGAANEAAGKLQKKVGKASANGTAVVKGTVREMAGKAQKSFGNAKESASAKVAEMRSDARSSRTGKRDRTIDRHAH